MKTGKDEKRACPNGQTPNASQRFEIIYSLAFWVCISSRMMLA